ncbi:unnamed protein product [Cuscuta campestris]|uniref:Reverse transcriptase domain-containing protein n=1 Tax=Cuscuta campestris TaxID=132261 RepID=A0A484LSM3_9ASTE|nr:unnamed protein product [Cuscuta campestris]
MRGLANKLKGLKFCIKEWNANHFGNIFTKVKEAEDAAIKAQERFESCNTDENREAFHLANANLLKACKTEENYLAQNANIKWLASGDASTKYFHSLVKGKRRQASIRELKDHSGKVLLDLDLIANYISNHYEATFSEDYTGNLGDIIANIPTVINDLDNQCITTLPLEEEIKAAIWQLNPNSSAGPDGYNEEFFTLLGYHQGRPYQGHS